MSNNKNLGTSHYVGVIFKVFFTNKMRLNFNYQGKQDSTKEKTSLIQP